MNTLEDVLRLIEEEDVEFIRLQFTDLQGNLKNIAVTAMQFERVLANGCLFNAERLDGIERPEGSERLLNPDFSTFEIFPWRPQQGKVARLLCNVEMPDGSKVNGDPRTKLQEVLAKAKAMGYTFDVGPECEFFLFETDENANPTVHTNEHAGYFDIGPLDCGENARRDMVLTLEDMGFMVEASHHEVAPAQHEIDLTHDEALKMADDIQTFKLAVRTIAKKHGLHATFMPKPLSNQKGSGMHISLALKKDGKNIFGDATDSNGLSKEGYYFLGGLMKHMRAMSAITNPIVNSYKRLLPDSDIPRYIAWSRNFRNQMIRIPAHQTQKHTRIELRNPDASANPYLMLALILAAGLDGIENKIMPPKAIDEDIDKMSAQQRSQLGLEVLPDNLREAINVFEQDTFVRSVLGDHLVNRYAMIKRAEWQKFMREVSQWELDAYLERY